MKAIRNNLFWAGVGMVALVATVIAVSVVLLSTGEGKRPPKPPAPFVPPPAFPASFFTGPLGAQNILPPTRTGALLGSWPVFANGWTWAQQKQGLIDRQAYFGRSYDLIHLHYGAPDNTCYSVAPLSDDRAAWVVNETDSILIVSWTHGWTIDEVNLGMADACLADVGRRLAAYGRPILLRIYWEFNGTWFNWRGTGPTFIMAWQRTVQRINADNVGFIWSPASGFRQQAFAGYPGDTWVDWVGVSAYNHNSGFCSKDVIGWCELRHLITQRPDPYAAPEDTVYDRYSAVKPYMLTETGSVEGTPGRKGQWFLNALSQIPNQAPNVRGITYFDQDVTATEGVNWRIDTSTSSLDAWKQLVLTVFFNTYRR